MIIKTLFLYRRILNFILLFFVILFFVLANLVVDVFRPADKHGVISILNIQKGTTTSQIGEILYEKKLIVNKNLFIFLAKTMSFSTNLKAGTYKINSSNNMFVILNKLNKGDYLKIQFTVPEGYTLDQINGLLIQKKIISGKKFQKLVNTSLGGKILGLKTKTLEGYLFPDTYFIALGKNIEIDIIKMMHNRLKQTFAVHLKQRAIKLNLSLQEVLILASLIEKEAKIKEEKYLVSSVFHNRLKKKLKLEACSTVRYSSKNYKNKLTYNSLKIKSPYNTYKYYGLPPSAICNPGKDAIIAALYPAKTNYLYFVLKDKMGFHYFSSTFKEHNKMVKKLRKK
ncbi:MAG: endolytic transglycosylase MltG [bacterium]